MATSARVRRQAPRVNRLVGEMEHDEFRRREKELLWGVTNFYRAVILVWGSAGLVSVAIASAFVLGPTLLLAGYALYQAKYLSLLWVVPPVLAFLSGRPNLNCIDGAVWLLPILVGGILALPFGPLQGSPRWSRP